MINGNESVTCSIGGNKGDMNMMYTKLRLTIKDVCHMLSVERDKLNKLVKTDPSFPRPIKEGASRQAAVYFDHSELIEWWEVKKQARYS
jgi:predicted DNA-binding transcriptional regulator AlpA